MTAKSELMARIAELSESIAAMAPQDFIMESELTLTQFRTIYMLAAGPARITDISQYQGMARPNASTMVERLVRKGLVERVSDPSDRRVTLACLTDKGRETIEAVNRHKYEAVEKIAAYLSTDELEVVARALEILDRGVKLMEASNEDDAPVLNDDD